VDAGAVGEGVSVELGEGTIDDVTVGDVIATGLGCALAVAQAASKGRRASQRSQTSRGGP
jgi:hypothetical protein